MNRRSIPIATCLFATLFLLAMLFFRYCSEPRPKVPPYQPAPRVSPTASSSSSPSSSPKTQPQRLQRAVIRTVAAPHGRIWYAGEQMDGDFVVPSGLFIIVNRLAESGRCVQGFPNVPCGIPQPDGSWWHVGRCFGPPVDCPECLPVVTKRNLSEANCATTRAHFSDILN